MVSALVAPLDPGMTEGGSNEQLRPAGRLEQARVTEPLNPFSPFTGILDVTELPGAHRSTVRRRTEAEIRSSAAQRLKGGHLHHPVPGPG